MKLYKIIGFVTLLTAMCFFDLVYSIKVHSEKCHFQEDCDTGVCHRVSGIKVCGCLRLIDYTIGSSVEQLYNNGICKSKINQMCTLLSEQKDGVAQLDCIENAVCKFAANGIGSKDIFGVCSCKDGFVSNKERTACLHGDLNSTLANVTPLIAPGTQSSERPTNASKLTVDKLASASANSTREPTVFFVERNKSNQNALKDIVNASVTSSSVDIKSSDSSFDDSNLQQFATENEMTKYGGSQKSKAIIKKFGEKCALHAECVTKYCSKESKRCACNKLEVVTLEKIVEQYYIHGICTSRVNQVCDVLNDSKYDGFGKWDCVQGSICSIKEFNKIEGLVKHGVCVCRHGFKVHSDGKSCMPKEIAESQIKNIEPRSKFVFAQQSFRQTPKNQTSVVGDTVLLHCSVDNKQGELQWTKDGFGLGMPVDLKDRERYSMKISDDQIHFDLEIQNVTLEDEGVFQCQVGNGRDGSQQLRSGDAKLTVDVPTSFPVIIQGNTIFVVENQHAQVDCVSEGGKPAAEVLWIDENGSVMKEAQIVQQMLDDEKRFNMRSSLRFKGTQQLHNKTLTCQAYNKPAKQIMVTHALIQIMYAPLAYIVFDPETINEFSNLHAICKANASPPVTNYKWYMNGKLLSMKDDFDLVLFNVSRAMHNSVLSCSVGNDVGQSNCSGLIAVQYGPRFRLYPRDVEAEIGTYFTLYCDVDSNPNPIIVWIHEVTQTVVHHGKNYTTILTHLNQGVYICRGQVVGYLAISAKATVYIMEPPKIVSKAVQFGVQGDAVNLECVAKAKPLPKFFIWSRFGFKQLTNNSEYFIASETVPIGMRSVVSFDAAKEEHFGQYICTVANAYGNDTMEIFLINNSIKKYIYFLVCVAVGLFVIIVLCAVVIWLCAANTRRRAGKNVKTDKTVAGNRKTDDENSEIQSSSNGLQHSNSFSHLYESPISPRRQAENLASVSNESPQYDYRESTENAQKCGQLFQKHHPKALMVSQNCEEMNAALCSVAPSRCQRNNPSKGCKIFQTNEGSEQSCCSKDQAAEQIYLPNNFKLVEDLPDGYSSMNYNSISSMITPGMSNSVSTKTSSVNPPEPPPFPSQALSGNKSSSVLSRDKPWLGINECLYTAENKAHDQFSLLNEIRQGVCLKKTPLKFESSTNVVGHCAKTTLKRSVTLGPKDGLGRVLVNALAMRKKSVNPESSLSSSDEEDESVSEDWK